MEQKKLEPSYRLHKRLQKLMRDAIKEFSMIQENDKILLGLSGGKDSLALLDLMGEFMNHSNHYFSIIALHVKMKNIDYVSDFSYLREKAAHWNIPLEIIEMEFEKDKLEKRTPCFLCSWNRRKTLFETAQRLHCTKIALGHHQDDILRTALMNLTFNGSFSTMPAKISMRKFDMTIIRPLAKIPETDLKQWAVFQDYQPLKKLCPYDNDSNRTSIQNVQKELEKLNPEYRYNLWHALLKANALIE